MIPELNLVARQPMRAKASIVSISVYVTLVAEVHEQMFRSSDQSEVKPPVFSSQESLEMDLIYNWCTSEKFNQETTKVVASVHPQKRVSSPKD
ncbi:hypothetical protein TNCV_4429271 [Trichonephila clavipes]|nr:hypothetical protein TNCV_4429271 [Trichonephila clavipes]